MFVGKTKAKSRGMLAAFATTVLLVGGSAASAADMNAMVTKAPMTYVAPAAVACGSAYDFFFTACPLTWYGVTFYGTVDLGGTYQTHGTPFDPNFPTGASYFLNPTNRTAGFGLAPNGLSQSNVGVKIAEPVGGGWSFVANAQLAFDPYSLLLANAPQALQNAIGVPLNQELLPVDSSRWGWLAAENYLGASSPVYGTLTFGRQNTPLLDGVNSYDPMGGSYAFSPIGFSGKTCGAGDTEECRWTTAIKYRENIGPFRLVAMGQPIGGASGGYSSYNPNNGAIAGGIGGDIKNVVPGVISLDVLGEFDKDAVNIGPAFNGAGATASGMPIAPFPPAYLRATLSNQTSFMALAKWTFGNTYVAPPLAVKGAPPPPPTPLVTIYAGYEWIQFANPSDKQTSFRDDGFLFLNPNTTNHGQVIGPNFTAINNNAFNAGCGTGPTGCSNEIFQVMWVGAKYGITKDLDIIGGYYHYIQNQFTSGAATCLNSGAHSQCAGTADMASGVIDWRFLPKWDWYIGTFFTQFNGGLDNGYLSRNNLATTSGVRFRF